MKRLIRITVTIAAYGIVVACSSASAGVTKLPTTIVNDGPSTVEPRLPTIEPQPTLSVGSPAEEDAFLDQLAEDTWTYLTWAASNHLPWSWRSTAISGGDYANPAEIGLYALSWLAAYDLRRPWSPSWAETETEVGAILDQLRAWQTGSQSQQPNGPNAYQNSVFYQWYWISWIPPVVGAGTGDRLVPSVDNAWLAVSLIVTREYAEANGQLGLAQKADAILSDMDFTVWYHYDTHRFNWGAVENPQGGTQADYYSNENRIINFVARALGQLDTQEYQLSLQALVQAPSTYDRGTPDPDDDIIVERVAWDGSYFTYAAPALFIREPPTTYGANTLAPATLSQIAYAQDQGYVAWGLSDAFDVDDGGYVQQGAPPAPSGTPETQPGLVSPHVSTLALIAPYASAAITNLHVLSDTFPNLYDSTYGFHDSVLADPGNAKYGHVSARFTTLAQAWVFLALANYQTGFIWNYLYRDLGVWRAHIEMYGGSFTYLPLFLKTHS